MEGNMLGTVIGEEIVWTKLSKEVQTNSISSLVSPKRQKSGCWLKRKPKKNPWNKVILAAALGNLPLWHHLDVNSCHSKCSGWVIKTVTRIIKDKKLCTDISN